MSCYQAINRFVEVINRLSSNSLTPLRAQCPRPYAITVLHAHDAGVALACEVPEDVPVVDLSGGRLPTPRIVPHLDVGDLGPRLVEIPDEIPHLGTAKKI